MTFWKTVGCVGMVAAGGVAAFYFAPAIAAYVGATGLLGAAGTGTAIVTLEGAALTSASLAALGGSMAAGTAVITGLGAGASGAVFAICNHWENGETKKAKEKIKKFAGKNRTEFRKAYKILKKNMSPAMRAEWEKHLKRKSAA